MRKICIIIILAISYGLNSMAQEKAQLLQRINDIKSQSDIYYWDRYTHTNADSAKVNATKRMLIEININKADDEKMSVDKIMPITRYIKINRGPNVQYFAYVKKEEVAVMLQGTSNNVQKKSITDDKITSTQTSISVAIRKFVPDAFVQRIVQTKVFMDVYKLLKSLKEQGQILQFGKLKDVEDYSSLDLILFDMQSQEVITLLSPTTESGNRINLVNGSDDSLDNYPTEMTAVIWYIKK